MPLDAVSRGQRSAAPTLALAGAVFYAAAELLRHSAVPSPPGVPGDSGGSALAVLALGIVAALGPSLLALTLLRRWRRFADFCGLVGGVWIFASAGLWRALDRAGVLLDYEGLSALLFILPGLMLAGAAAALLWPLLLRWPARGRIRHRIFLALLLIALGWLGVDLRVESQGNDGSAAGPNFLLVTIDTVRRDALGAWGGPATALDSLDAVAHDAWSVSPWTQPSMASLFTGVIPTGHGSDPHHGPDPAMAWWPEALEGSQNAAFVTNPYLRRRFGFDRGFAHFDHAEEPLWIEPVARTVIAEWTVALLNERESSDRADTVVGRARKWLAATSPDRPWFLWVHLLDPHLPYVLRGPGGAVRAPEVPGWAAPLRGQYEAGGFSDLRGVRDSLAITTESERAALHQLYLTGVDYAAWWTRELIYAAQTASAASSASAGRELKWIVTSDHGEEFFESGGFEHGHSLGDELLAVPLLSSGMGEAPRSPRLIDVGPWVLAELAVRDAFDARQGSQLLDSDSGLFGLATGSEPARAACGRPAMIAEGLLYGPPRTLVVGEDGQRWLRRDPDGAPVLVGDCAQQAGEAVAVPWAQLDFWRERRTVSPLGIELDDELRRQLRALGYVR